MNPNLDTPAETPREPAAHSANASPVPPSPARGATSPGGMRYWPLLQLVLARLREFYREPEAVFWVYGFPLLTVVALGVAFRNKPVEHITVDVQQGKLASLIEGRLKADPKQRFDVHVVPRDAWRKHLRTGKADLAIVPRGDSVAGTSAAPTAEASTSADARAPKLARSDANRRAAAGGSMQYEYWFDPTRSESLLARNTVDDTLQRAADRRDAVPVSDHEFSEPGGRYIDFLIPGLLGMSLMGGGLWGVGYVTVDMRIRKLLKRFLATPMKRGHFLAGLMISRLIFLIPEVLVLLLFARLAFGVVIHGSLWSVVILILLGAWTFAGIGLLVASRAKTIEAVSGLMNLVMLPMWVLSGVFFSSDRFPAAAQPFIQALPLTSLNNALRAVMQEGEPLWSQGARLGILAAWGFLTFVLALRWFRWS